jgi:hypothetical protein
MFGRNIGHQISGFLKRKQSTPYDIWFNPYNYKLDMACILKNGQGYKIKQTKAPSLDTFPYGISNRDGFSRIIFVTLHIGIIKNIIYVLSKAI